MPQQLASFPGPKTGRGYSAIVLDRSQVPPSSPCTRTLGGAWERGYISLVRLPKQQHALLPLLSWAYSACVLVALLFRQRGGLSYSVQFYVQSQLSGSSIVCEVLRGSLREDDCAISTNPEASLRELSVSTTP